jgi:hypothetical protein
MGTYEDGSETGIALLLEKGEDYAAMILPEREDHIIIDTNASLT